MGGYALSAKSVTNYPTRQGQLTSYFYDARGLRWLARNAILERNANAALDTTASAARGQGAEPALLKPLIDSQI